MTPATTVLICAGEPMLAALLGMLVEMAHHTAAYPEPGERPEDAVARVRPLLVVLLDGALDSARSDLFFAQAARRRVGVALFGAKQGATALSALARARRIPWFEAPIGLAEFRRVLDEAGSSEWWRDGEDRRGARPRRQSTPRAERTEDGTLVFLDRHGARWLVYDRRGADRRRGQRRGEQRGVVRARTPEPDRRVFVNEAGETWECALMAGEIERRTPTALERQLARATRI